MWSQTAKELLFINFGPPQIWSASYSTSEASFRADKPHLWSPRNFLQRPRIRALNLHPDGKRIAMAVVPDPQGPVKQDEVVFVFNFFDELKRLAPRK
jgi:hypothetical protein